MAQSKKAAARMGRVNQRDCLVFASHLYNFTMCHPDIQRFLPPPLSEEQETPFTENIGKKVFALWYVKLEEFRRYDQYNLKLLASPNIQKHLHPFCRSLFKASKDIFSAVIYMSAFLMEIHMFLYRRSFEVTLKRLPALWTSLFQTYFAQEFFSKGSWSELKLYAQDGSEIFEAELRGFSIGSKLNLYAVTKHQYRKLDRTKEFRLFVVQKSLEILDIARKKLIRGELTFLKATEQVFVLSKHVSKVLKLCEDLDSGKSDIDILNEYLRRRIVDLTLEFHNKVEFMNIARRGPHDESGIADESPAYVDFEDESTESPYSADDLEDINVQWLEEVTAVRRELRRVMPPGTNDSNIDVLLEEDYADTLVMKWGGLREGGNTLRNVGMDEVLAELNKTECTVWGVYDEQIENWMLEEQSKIREEKALGLISPTEGPSSVQPAAPPLTATGGARPKSTILSSSESTPGTSRRGKSSKPTLESSVEDPFLEESMEGLNISGKKMEHPEKKSSKSKRRKRKGSKR